MTPKRFMVIAGEASGDLLAAELVRALREKLHKRQGQPSADVQPLEASLEPEFFGAGGPAMRAAGVGIEVEMIGHAVVGLVEIIPVFIRLRRIFHQLLRLAIERQPHAIICVDFGGFNRRFAHAVQRYLQTHKGTFLNWRPKLIQYISPQVWASRPSRADGMARDFDLLLSIFPFEKDWYARYTPDFRVEYVGHPLVDRYSDFKVSHTAGSADAADTMSPLPPHPGPLPRGEGENVGRPVRESTSEVGASGGVARSAGEVPVIVLLPGSRIGELARHLPVMRDAVQRLRKEMEVRWEMVVPTGALAVQARAHFAALFGGDVKVGGLGEALSWADIAIASTGTVTLECAWFGVPTVAIYKTSWSTYEIAKRIINVGFLAMPNILAGHMIFPEFVQHEATGENIAAAALKLLREPAERKAIKVRLRKVVSTLGRPGAARRAADAVLRLGV
jgi:lipid-A-disaccharide synthase